MIIAGPKREDKQLLLFDLGPKLITSLGAVRWEVGEYFEDLTAQHTGAVRLKTDSRCDVCPDLGISDTRYLEVKGMGKSGRVILYRGRVEKYTRFVSQGNELTYFIWHHVYRSTGATDVRQLRAGLCQSLRDLFILSHSALVKAIGDIEPKLLNTATNKDGSRCGWGQAGKGYGIGWTLSKAQLLEVCQVQNVAYSGIQLHADTQKVFELLPCV